ncbi:MAG: Glutathione-specific gamma-glutamylcyclotransferase [Paracidovorax wautersii]|uniref:glutathione-specific gamma-glutamylcyclotransferase n=1 Tax=Paracidovorax wautersii TaxID=1177982 RepID=A0A7V8JRG2_9BURK|nr:MAG: Glutathione-specific gamma-glutamylcyclotransferase [Paracidovorax wautersii]
MPERLPAAPCPTPLDPLDPLDGGLTHDGPPPHMPPPASTVDAAASDALRRQVLSAGWQPGHDLWVFGYASLIWRQGFECLERRPALLKGYHRALKMWSHVNRGTPQCPGLVFALLPGGSCQGVALRMPADAVPTAFDELWRREMPDLTYQPRWLSCRTPAGSVKALAFTLSRRSPSHTGTLSNERYRQVFTEACGHYGTTLDYAQRTDASLRAMGIQDRALAGLLALADGRANA